MGRRYDAGVVYGLLYSDGEDGWPEETLALRTPEEVEEGMGFDIEEWLDRHLGVTPWTGETATWDAWKSERREKCEARYGVPGFERLMAGYVEYATNIVHVAGQSREDWRVVPAGNLEVNPVHEIALRRLAEDLPGAAGPPQWWAYCSVG